MLRGYHLYNKESGSWSCFFFFKQKTAYEIWRDWSSDVCPSDLGGLGGLALLELVLQGGHGAGHRGRVRRVAGEVALVRVQRLLGAAGVLVRAGNVVEDVGVRLEIGSASCRERVEISAVAGSLKT